MEALLEFQNTVEDPEGRSYVATVLGTERDDGRWIGWIRFVGTDGDRIETGRETTQPNRNDLLYWSKGLTYFYLEGALGRARSRAQRLRSDAAVPAASADAGETKDGALPRGIVISPPERGVPRIEVITATGRVAEKIMGVREPRAGTAREVPSAGLVVYEGSVAGEAESHHFFAIQFGSENSGAAMANWLWSRLHAAGAVVRVDGHRVELTNDGLKRALIQ